LTAAESCSLWHRCGSGSVRGGVRVATVTEWLLPNWYGIFADPTLCSQHGVIGCLGRGWI